MNKQDNRELFVRVNHLAELIEDLERINYENQKTNIFLSSFQFAVIVIGFSLVIILSVIVYKRIVKGINNGFDDKQRMNGGSDYDNRFQVVVDNCPKQSASKSTDNKSNRRDTYSRRPNDSFESRISKTSDALQSIPEQKLRPEQHSIKLQELIHRMNGSDERSAGHSSFGRQVTPEGHPSSVRHLTPDIQSSGETMFSDTILKMDEIIDQTFDSIIDSIEDNSPTHRYSDDY